MRPRETGFNGQGSDDATHDKGIVLKRDGESRE